jgi:hypothetical protein
MRKGRDNAAGAAGAVVAVGATAGAATGATDDSVFWEDSVFEDWQPANKIADDASINGTNDQWIKRALFFMVYFIFKSA